MNKQRDTSIGQLVRFFCAGKDPLSTYEWDQKKEGSDLTLKLALGHGVDGKALISATKEFPKDASGSPVVLSSFDAISKPLSASAMKLWRKMFAANEQSSGATAGASPSPQ